MFTRQLAIYFTLILFALLLAYSPTLAFPYLLTDETWIIRVPSGLWGLATGRPLFSLSALGSELVRREIGLDVIYLMRLSAILGLAVVALMLMRWFEIFGRDRASSCLLAIAIMTLPAFQIIVADGTQLAYAVLFAVLAAHAFRRGFEDRSTIWMLIAAFLLLASLAIYQQQTLVFFAMLAIALLSRPDDKRIYVHVIAGGVFMTVVSTLYFIGWSMLYRIFYPDRVDARYGPDAVDIPSLDQIARFIDTRLVQVANLWDVGGPNFGHVWIPVVALIAIKIAYDLWKRPRSACVVYPLLVGLIVACDSFALLARAYYSYITATALSMAIFYLAFLGASILVRPPVVASGVAVLGAVLAFSTVRDNIAYPNWRHMQQIREAIITNPDKNSFHIIGIESNQGTGYQEFSWRNATADNYLYLTALNIVDDLRIKGIITPEHRNRLYLSVSGTMAVFAPDSTPSKPKSGAVVVRLH